MCTIKEKNILNHLSENFNLVKHIHIAVASGIDGEGESLKKLDKDQKKFFKKIIDLPLIKVIEVWQGHLNNFKGFKQELNYLNSLSF